MKLVTVDIAGLQVSNDLESCLVTYALGSCIGVTVWDKRLKVAGMIHYMLPMSATSPEKAKEKPAMFADTGIPLLFDQIYRLGCQKKDLVVKVMGGASLYDDKGLFEIGKKNHTMVRKMLWKVGVPIAAEDCGGSKSRTARLFVATGQVVIRSDGGDFEL